jgi:hypothetical protein
MPDKRCIGDKAAFENIAAVAVFGYGNGIL